MIKTDDTKLILLFSKLTYILTLSYNKGSMSRSTTLYLQRVDLPLKKSSFY